MLPGMARFLFIALTFFCLSSLGATHYRAGEIVVEFDGECGGPVNRVCATIITYTVFPSEADRDTLPLDWGDGTIVRVARSKITMLENGVRRNEYRACHNYSGPGTYFISTEDNNRVAQILNLNFPNSVEIPFSVFTSYTLTNSTFFGCNSSPILDQIPLDMACQGEVWTHNPGAFDPDGDSLKFELAVPLSSRGIPVPNYVFPNQIGGIGTLDIDSRTGQITWDSPNIPGEYNLAFHIISFRNGQPLDTMIRDMQITVEDCMNDPPEIEKPFEEICVIAGTLIEFPVTATAPLTDEDQLIRLQAAGGPFIGRLPQATFEPNDLFFEDDPKTRVFRWQTTCDHISDQPYIVVFRAEDNFFADTAGLTTIQTVTIKVVAPPPENVTAEEEPGLVTLRWDLPYFCEATPDPEFEGFTVWRREGSDNTPVDTCETGMGGRGYTLLTPDPVLEMEDQNYIYFDDTAERGRTYCYRLLAEFARRSPINNLIFEEIESIPSMEVCVQLPRDLPLITKVDVTSTSTTDGGIDVCWIRPDPMALDTTVNRGPYRYVLFRAPGLAPGEGDFVQLAEYTTAAFSDPVDTCFADTGLDTENEAYTYRVDFFVNGESEPIEGTQTASSVRLGAAPTDRAVDLSWTANVPWTNLSSVVFRRLPGATEYDSIATVSSMMYRDTGLINGETYCYFVRTEGSYGVESIPSPLLNRSQEICVEPLDNVAPCPPVLAVSSVCDRGVDCTIPDNLFNLLTWQSSEEVCGDTDVASYRVYFSEGIGGTPTLIANIEDDQVLRYEDFPDGGSILGCYYVSAVDRNGNESELSNEVCVSNCPFYELPNAFTPNGDSQNDLYRPRGFCFVESVVFEVFNRWGGLVFTTTDPELNWDGTNLNGEELASGTYFYVCRVFEERLDGVSESSEPLRGYIELIRPTR